MKIELIFKRQFMIMKPKSTMQIFPILLVLYEISTYLSNDMYLPALPQMMADIGLTMHQAQFTLTAWFLGSAGMPLVMGVISDRYGRRPVLLIGGIIYLLATMVCALTHDPSILLAARVVEGAMIPSMMVPGYACIHEMYEQREAIRMLALMGSISVLAPAFGPLLGSIVLTLLNWRWIFWIIILWAGIALLFLNRWMPETLPPGQRQPVHLGRLSQQYWRVLTNLKFLTLMCVLGFVFAGFLAWIAAGPILVIVNFHYSAIAFGVIQAAIFIVYIIGNRWVNYFMEWLGVSKLILTGLAITLMGGLAVLLMSVLFPTTLYPFLGAMMIYSFGSALCFAPLNRTIIESSDESMGIRVALFTVFLTGSAALGSGMAGMFFDGSILSLATLIAAGAVLACIMQFISRLVR